MKVVGVIPARYASTRFPGKPLVKINGREMILRVLDGVKTCSLINEVIVATDDQRIKDCVEKAGGRAVMTSADCQTGTDRIWEAVREMNVDLVVNIQGDEPLISSSHLEALLKPLMADANLQMSTLAHEISDEDLHSAQAVKVIVNQNDEAIYFSRFAIPYSREAYVVGQKKAAFKHIGLYAFQKSFLKKFCEAKPAAIELGESLEQLRALYLGARIKVGFVKEATPSVDTPEDLKKVEKILGDKR